MIDFLPSREVAVQIGSFSVHWYGLMYLSGFLIGAMLLPHLQKLRWLKLTADDRSSLLMHIVLGVLIGGRLGYVLFYSPAYYLDHPSEIFQVWLGGMSSHGGFIGVLIAVWYYSHKRYVSLLAVLDTIVVPVAIGLALGRVGNFINGELYGTVTGVPWAMSFPGAQGLRHPTQLYAVIKDLLIASACFVHLFSSASGIPELSRSRVHGTTTALFLILYAIFRIFVEHFREQPFGFATVGGVSLSWGQLYSVPIFLLGIGLVFWIKWRNSRVPVSHF